MGRGNSINSQEKKLFKIVLTFWITIRLDIIFQRKYSVPATLGKYSGIFCKCSVFLGGKYGDILDFLLTNTVLFWANTEVFLENSVAFFF